MFGGRSTSKVLAAPSAYAGWTGTLATRGAAVARSSDKEHLSECQAPSRSKIQSGQRKEVLREIGQDGRLTLGHKHTFVPWIFQYAGNCPQARCTAPRVRDPSAADAHLCLCVIAPVDIDKRHRFDVLDPATPNERFVAVKEGTHMPRRTGVRRCRRRGSEL